MKDRFHEVVRQYAKHQNYAKIGDFTGLSRQRVCQIMQTAREKGMAPPVHKEPPKSHAQLTADRRALPAVPIGPTGTTGAGFALGGFEGFR